MATTQPQSKPATLQDAGLPPRVRDALTALLGLVRQHMDGAVYRAIEKMEWDVTNGSTSNDWMKDRDDHNLIMDGRTRMLPTYMSRIESALAGLRREGESLVLREKKKSDSKPSSQWLLESQSGKQTTFEESTFANALISTSQLPVYLLSMRIGVLAGAPAVETDLVPLGPKFLLDTFSEATEATFGEAFTAPKLLMRFYEELVPLYPAFIEDVNELLGNEGILPGLTHMPVRRKAIAAPSEAPKTASPAWKAQAHTGEPMPAQAAMPGWLPPSNAAAEVDWLDQPDVEAYMRRSTDRARGGQNGVANRDSGGGGYGGGGGADAGGYSGGATGVGGYADGAPGPGGSGAAGASGGVERRGTDLLRMRQMLAAHRAASGLDAMAHVARRQEDELPRQAVNQAFDRLQDRTRGSVDNLHDAGIRSIDDLREHLLGELRQEHGAEKGLSRIDADILDLFGLLYQALAGEVRAGSPVSTMLDRLQVPLARAALDDNTFFEASEHPGRRVLELVADSDTKIAGEGGLDPYFENAVERAVMRIENDFRGDTGVLESVSEELAVEQKQHVKRAEATEHRQVEAARGKERLFQARQETQTAVNEWLEGASIPAASENLIRTAWQDALSFVMLRSGAESEAWAQQKAITHRIIETVGAQDGRTDKELETLVAKALRRVGYHESDALSVAELLSRGRDAERDEFSASPTAVAARIANHARFGEEGDHAEEPVVPKPPRNPEEQSRYELLRELPIGTWYDFILNQQGDIERRRMSWYSPISDRLLLVNRRGQRVADMTMDDMARLMAVGQVTVARREELSVVNRALRSVSSLLSNIRGGNNRKGKAA